MSTAIWVPSRLSDLLAPSSDVSMGGFKLVLLGAPLADGDAATKAYVDTHAGLTTTAHGGIYKRRFKSQLLYSAPMGALTNITPTLNRGYFMPAWLDAVQFDRIGCHVGAAGGVGAVVRLGIYADDGFGLPTGLPLLDAGTVNSNGATGDLRITIAYTPPAYDLYHLVGVPQVGTVATMVGTLSGGVNPDAPMQTSSTGQIGCIVNGFAAGALPDATGVTFVPNSASHPRVFMRTT